MLAQFDQLQINVAHGRKIRLHNLDVQRAVVLQAIQHVQSATSALALGRIGRVGDLLQLAQDELRNNQRARQEAGLSHVGNAAVDDHRGIENLQITTQRFVTEDAAER